MKNILPTRFFAALLATAPIAGCASNASPARSPAGGEATTHSLDGRTFLVEAEPDAERQKLPDAEFAFAGGMLDSSACRAQGLPPVPYEVRSDGTFYAERRSGDSLDTWNGRATMDRIEGTYVSMKGAVKTQTIVFRGRVR
jgi:hypothetical protein